MAAPPLVTIAVINYNYGAFLAEALQSALAQTHAPLEVLLVDDGSTDDSLEIARDYPALRVLAQKNQGVCVARNHGAARAGGAYLMFLDADDKLEPDYVERCLAALQAAPQHVAYAYTQMRLFGNEESLFPSRPFNRRALLKSNFVHSAALIRREVFVQAGGFDEGWRKGYEDYELWVRLLSLGYEGVLVERPLLLYRKHGPSRNTLPEAHKMDLQWRLHGSYPRLYLWLLWRRPLKIPRFILWIFRAWRLRAHGGAA